MKITLPAGALSTPYAKKIYSHLLKSAKKIDHWANQANVISLTEQEKLWYNRNRAIRGTIAELAFFKLLCQHNIEFIHNNKIPIISGKRKFECDIDFTIMPIGLNIDVKTYLPTFISTTSIKSWYHAHAYLSPVIPKEFVEYKNGLSLIRHPQRLAKIDLEVNALGIIPVDNLKNDISIDDLISLDKFFGNLKSKL
jgi:hypothetical protein